MKTSRLHHTRYNYGNGQRGGATVKRFYLFGYLVAWRTVDTWREAWDGHQWVAFSVGTNGKEDYAPPDELCKSTPYSWALAAGRLDEIPIPPAEPKTRALCDITTGIK